MTERWLPVVGQPDYEVSDLGRLRNTKTGHISKARPSKSRRLVTATFAGKKRESMHRVVLRAFVREPPEGCEGSHLNGDSTDNRLSNLAWEDHTTNIRRKHDHGTTTRGEAVNTAKLTEADVQEIRKLYAAGATGAQIAARFGLAHRTVYSITLRQSWRHVA